MKRIKRFLSLALALCMLCTGGFALSFAAGAQSFEELTYQRPDTAALQAAADRAEAAVKSGGIIASVRRFDEFFDLYYDFYSMMSLSRIRCFQDLSNEFYGAEYLWCSQNSVDVERLLAQVYGVCSGSGVKAALLKALFFREADSEKLSHAENEATVSLRNRETELINRYYELLTDPTIMLHGKKTELKSYLANAGADDRSEAYLEYCRQYNRRIADIYIELVKVRIRLAGELGYEDVWQMYAAEYGRAFRREQAAAYLTDIERELVPLFKEYVSAGAHTFRLRVDEGTLISVAGAAADAMGGKVKTAFDAMVKYNMYDISARENKADEDFTLYLSSASSPFVFLSPTGESSDIFDFCHEFGHFTQMFCDRTSPCPLELSECFSQGMELLALRCGGSVLSENVSRTLLRRKLSNMLSLYVEQAAFASFEETVYSLDPEVLTADTLNAICLSCASRFGLTEFYGREYSAYLWADLLHFFECPCYVLSYCISADAAMQLYVLESEKGGAGIKAYEKLLSRHNADLLSSLKRAGLESPFAENRVSAAADVFESYLKKLPS